MDEPCIIGAAQYMRCIAILNAGHKGNGSRTTKKLLDGYGIVASRRAVVGSVKLAPSQERGAKQPPWVLPGFVKVARGICIQGPYE